LAQLLLLILLPLLFLGEVMPNRAAGHRSQHRMMACHMACYGTHGSPLEATTRRRVR
jgi:hypothetical protein